MKLIENQVNELLEFIKKSMENMNLDAENVFMNGNCGNLYTIFAKYFSREAVIPYEILYRGIPRHIVTKIGDNFYDITGKTSLDDYINYAKDHSTNSLYRFDKETMEMKEIGIKGREYRIRQQSDMYNYDENYGVSLVSNQMEQLYENLRKFKDEKAKEV